MIKLSGGVRRLCLGVGATGLTQVIAAAQSILLVPLFLRAWGSEGYGHWLVLTAFVSYLTLLDLGGQNYVANLLTQSHARGDVRGFCETLSRGMSLFIGIAAGALIVLAAALFAALPLAGSGLSASDRWVMLLASTSLLIMIPNGLYTTAYRATGQFARAAMLGNAIQFAEFLLSASLLMMAVTPVAYVATLAAWTVVRTIIVVVDLRRTVLADCRLDLSLASAWAGRTLLGGSMLFWLMALSLAMNQQGVVLIVSWLVGPVGVALFATHRTAGGLVRYVTMLLQAPLWPELSRLWAAGRHDDFRRTSEHTVHIMALAGGLAGVLLWFLLPSIYPMWTGRELDLDPSLLGVLLLQAVLTTAWSTVSWGLLASNRHRGPALWSFVNGCATIALAVPLTLYYGVLGTAVASLIGDVACGLLVFPWLAEQPLGAAPCRREFLAVDAVTAACLLIGFVDAWGDRWRAVVPFALAAITLVWVVPSATAARSILARAAKAGES